MIWRCGNKDLENWKVNKRDKYNSDTNIAYNNISYNTIHKYNIY